MFRRYSSADNTGGGPPSNEDDEGSDSGLAGNSSTRRAGSLIDMARLRSTGESAASKGEGRSDGDDGAGVAYCSFPAVDLLDVVYCSFPAVDVLDMESAVSRESSIGASGGGALGQRASSRFQRARCSCSAMEGKYGLSWAEHTLALALNLAGRVSARALRVVVVAARTGRVKCGLAGAGGARGGCECGCGCGWEGFEKALPKPKGLSGGESGRRLFEKREDKSEAMVVGRSWEERGRSGGEGWKKGGGCGCAGGGDSSEEGTGRVSGVEAGVSMMCRM